MVLWLKFLVSLCVVVMVLVLLWMCVIRCGGVFEGGGRELSVVWVVWVVVVWVMMVCV